MLHNEAENWEVKAHQAEGQSSSVRMELLSVDTERRHLRERVELLENEIQEVILNVTAWLSVLMCFFNQMPLLLERAGGVNHQCLLKGKLISDLLLFLPNAC